MAIENPAPRVRAAVGFTRNMKNFESLRLDFDIEDSVRPDETVSEAAHRVYKKASDILVESLQELEDELKEASKGAKK